MYQSKTIPIPIYPPIVNSNQPNENSVNFIGRLAREILRLTDPKTSYYVHQKSAWYDLKTKEEILNLRIFKKLELCLNSFGLHGLDSLYSFMIAKDLQNLLLSINRQNKAFEELYKVSLGQLLPLDSNSSK
jgi:WASH complex subunit strumpellin